jgi:hypothetical protein
MSPISESKIDSTRCIIKAILCSGNNDVEYMSEEMAKNLDGKIK